MIYAANVLNVYKWNTVLAPERFHILRSLRTHLLLWDFHRSRQEHLVDPDKDDHGELQAVGQTDAFRPWSDMTNADIGMIHGACNYAAAKRTGDESIIQGIHGLAHGNKRFQDGYVVPIVRLRYRTRITNQWSTAFNTVSFFSTFTCYSIPILVILYTHGGIR